MGNKWEVVVGAVLSYMTIWGLVWHALSHGAAGGDIDALARAFTTTLATTIVFLMPLLLGSEL